MTLPKRGYTLRLPTITGSWFVHHANTRNRHTGLSVTASAYELGPGRGRVLYDSGKVISSRETEYVPRIG